MNDVLIPSLPHPTPPRPPRPPPSRTTSEQNIQKAQQPAKTQGDLRARHQLLKDGICPYIDPQP